MADHFVIDGSNLATEGRTEPSLAQLREAVAAFRGEHPGSVVTVVVDASFEHRIDPSERPAFAKVEAENEVVSPPAGAVGRGDGFLLQISNRTGATVVSNDSFQEFHAEYEWLFEPGRLIGGKPVPGVGWIFSLRRPVRGIVSRKTTQRAKKDEKTEKEARAAIAEATHDALTNQTGGRRRRRGGRGGKPAADTTEPEAVNQPAPFLQFVIDHRLGTPVDGVVDSFSSHGAFVVVDDVRCYVPLGAMGDPRPTRARDVLERGETRTFVVQAVDAPRRGIELALPGFEKIAGAPSDETVEAELKGNRPKKATGKAAPKPTPKAAPTPTTPPPRAAATKSTRSRRVRGVAPADAAIPDAAPVTETATPALATPSTPPKRSTATKPTGTKPASKPPAKRARAAKAAPATAKKSTRTTTKKATPAPATKAPAAKAPDKKTPAKKNVAKQAPAKKAPAKKVAAAKAPAKKVAKKVAKPATKPVAKKAPAPAAKQTAKVAKAPAAKKAASKRGRR